MTDDELRWLHAVSINCAYLAKRILEGKGNARYITEHDFLPVFKRIVYLSKKATSPTVKYDIVAAPKPSKNHTRRLGGGLGR